MFASLIIRLFQLVFSAGTVFFSHNESAGTIFRLVFLAKRTVPIIILLFISTTPRESRSARHLTASSICLDQ